ncbi:MAG TPA: ArsC family reductase [Roseateles sp.]|nr:ArsC family reductase [Roseateles sp.]
MITVYGIPNCDTVKRARAWLDEQGLAYRFHDYKKAGVLLPELQRWIAQFGWDKVINRAGTTWRKLDESLKAGVGDAAGAVALAQSQPSVIKRPIVQWSDGRLSLGFTPELFKEHA